MLLNYIKVTCRNLLRNSRFAAINIIGLALGLAVAMIIYLYVKTETSYDRFHTDASSIYRVLRQSQLSGMPYNIGVTSAPFADALSEDFAGRIQDVCRALPFRGLVRYADQSLMEDRLLIADSGFFTFFSYPLVKGTPNEVLSGAHSMVVSESFAKKYFGDRDPIGMNLRVDDTYDMHITGVMATSPNTHLQFDAVIPYAVIAHEDWTRDWWSNSFYTYVKVPDQAHAAQLDASFPQFMDKYFGKDFARVGNRTNLKLEPLRDIYFNFDTRYEQNVSHGDRKYMVIFGSIGLLVLLLAAINYINLATAQASARTKEVGVRKTFGSSRQHVAVQFLSESFVLCCFSLALATLVTCTAIPVLNDAFGMNLPPLFSDSSIGISMVAMLCSLTLLAGAYPAFLLSSFRPATAFRIEVTGMRYLLVRKALVVFQFSISVCMIVGTLFIGKQLRFMQQKDLGFKVGRLAVISLNNEEIRKHRESFRHRLVGSAGLTHASFTSGHPGGFYDATTVNFQGIDEAVRMRTLETDYAFLETMGLEMAAGRYFSAQDPSDSIHSVVLNETAVRQLGMTPEQIIGRRAIRAQFDSTYKEVIGVVKDYHFTSLKERIEPLIISCSTRAGNLVVRLSDADMTSVVKDVEAAWNYYNTGYPLEFRFIDDVINRLYRGESVQGRVFALFAALSLAIACMGIYGLAAYMAAKRTKEIGIRKVLGASQVQVSWLLIQEILQLVAIALVLSLPVSYLLLKAWSETFVYVVALSPMIFIAGAGILLAFALAIVGAKAGHVASRNPVLALKNE
ncbi:MAG TPA: ABC transporter permease [Chryseolinea sp.]|nr:ABC transporter permease [Chryseolinea sp.]